MTEPLKACIGFGLFWALLVWLPLSLIFWCLPVNG